jgi:mannose-6-phosphate isomerase-like protein (cupin superfamily)
MAISVSPLGCPDDKRVAWGKQEKEATMRPHAEARIARLAESETVPFGPLAHYNKLTGDDGLPIFTGVQTCKPGYQTPLHWHPYVECLFVIEGAMEAWLEGQDDCPARLGPGDMIALLACVPHIFRNAGSEQLRLLGIHGSPTRIVHRIEPDA